MPPIYGYGNLDPQVFQVFELERDLSWIRSTITIDVPAVHPDDLVRPARGRSYAAAAYQDP